MKTITAPTPYGYQELRQFQHRFMSLAMTFAISLQLVLIGGYYIAQYLNQPKKYVIPRARIRLVDLPQPPSIMGESQPINAGLYTRIENAIPKPANIDPNSDTAKTIPPQNFPPDYNNANTKLIADGKVDIVIVDPDEKVFRPWEINGGTLPNAIITPSPEYSELAKKANLEGSVTVEVLLDKVGKVREAKILKGNDEIFVQPALDAAKKWVFTPAIMNGKPVQVRVAIPFRFRLKQ
jgi:TonB family protein